MKSLIIRTLATAALLTTTAAVLATPKQDGKGRYAEVNGLKMLNVAVEYFDSISG